MLKKTVHNLPRDMFVTYKFIVSKCSGEGKKLTIPKFFRSFN